MSCDNLLYFVGDNTSQPHPSLHRPIRLSYGRSVKILCLANFVAAIVLLGLTEFDLAHIALVAGDIIL